jgi:hypothetical protein
MRRMNAITVPVALGVMLATTPQLTSGQRGEESPVEITLHPRPGTEIRVDQLGAFLAQSTTVSVDPEMPALSVTLLVEMTSREAGVVGRYASKPVEVAGSKMLAVSTSRRTAPNLGLWTPQQLAPNLGLWTPQELAPNLGLWVLGAGTLRAPNLGLWDRRQGALPRECRDATLAVRVSLVSDDERFHEPTAKHICLTAEG